eukprot:jgi/Galph1/4978/GphlegSOOS_G3662.1
MRLGRLLTGKRMELLSSVYAESSDESEQDGKKELVEEENVDNNNKKVTIQIEPRKNNTLHFEEPTKKAVHVDVKKFLKHYSEEEWNGQEEENIENNVAPKRPRKDMEAVAFLQQLPPPKKYEPVKDLRKQNSYLKGIRNVKKSVSKEPNYKKDEKIVSEAFEKPKVSEIELERNSEQSSLVTNMDFSHLPISEVETPKEFLKDINRYGNNVSFIDVKYSDLVDETKPDESFVTRQSVTSSDAAAKLTKVAGKVTRIQRERHQLNAVAADLAAKQVELEEKRMKSKQTKAETWAKYGW